MKTDNSHFEEKVLLRVESIKDIEKPVILELYAGKSTLWEEVKKRTGKNIEITRVEKIKNKCPFPHLQGDNLKFLVGMDISKYNIIDMDAYGVPAELIEALWMKSYYGVVVITAIRSVMGRMPDIILAANGYTEPMIKKAPILLSSNGLEKFLNFLYIKGIRNVSGFFFDRKYYITCKMEA